MRDGVRAAIDREEDMQVSGEAGTSAEAVEAFRSRSPDVVLVDIRLPDASGIETIAQIRQIDGAARILVLSTSDGDEDIRRALQAGALGYLLKSSPRAALLEAIRGVSAGNRCLPLEVEALLNERHPGGKLTDRESQVLRLIAKGLSDKEISSLLDLSIFTVNTHVRAILRKLGVQDRVQAALTALQRGFAEL